MLRIKYYPLVDADTDGKEKMPMFSTDNEHTVRKMHSTYLAEVIPKYYRFCSVNGVSSKEAESYAVHCPICGKVMKPISRLTNKYRLSLYHCVDCR